MPKTIDPALENEVARDILRTDATRTVAKAVVNDNPREIAVLVDRAAAYRRLHDQLDATAAPQPGVLPDA